MPDLTSFPTTRERSSLPTDPDRPDPDRPDPDRPDPDRPERPDAFSLPDLPRGAAPVGWRERLADLVAAWDLTPGRLAAAVVALGLVAVVAWRLLAPPAPPPEVRLPFAEQSATGPAADPASGESPSASRGGRTGPSAAPASSSAPASSAGAGTGAEVVVVHVVGAVGAPGVQRLPAGSRAVDAVAAAGGMVPEADLAALNLAAVLIDGQQLYVPRVGEVPPAAVPPAAGSAAQSGPAVPVDLNSATLDELDELPGIGPTTAQAILDHREQNGPFSTVEELLDVRGIGDAKLEQLRDLVAV
jgi:competence protein ComEA